MGLFDIFRDAKRETYGAILEKEYEKRMLLFHSLDPSIQDAVLQEFSRRLAAAKLERLNMTSKGRIDTGMQLRYRAAKIIETNISEGLILWMIGSWLESGEREAMAAAEVHGQLEELASRVQRPQIIQSEKSAQNRMLPAGRFSDTASNDLEEDHWAVLLKKIKEMTRLDDEARALALVKFSERIAYTRAKLDTMSQADRIKTGSHLMDEAYKLFDSNISLAYAAWLTGFWLAGMDMPGEDARIANRYLEDLANGLQEIHD